MCFLYLALMTPSIEASVVLCCAGVTVTRTRPRGRSVRSLTIGARCSLHIRNLIRNQTESDSDCSSLVVRVDTEAVPVVEGG